MPSGTNYVMNIQNSRSKATPAKAFYHMEGVWAERRYLLMRLVGEPELLQSRGELSTPDQASEWEGQVQREVLICERS
jgi:hypothetical protein